MSERLSLDFQPSDATNTSDIGRIVSDAPRTSNDWATPRWLLALLSPKGDHFDPCPLGGSGGLELEWPTDRLVYINPPFSNPLPWVRKAARHAGPVTMLLPVDPTTKWWTYSEGFEVILINSRLHFNEATTYARQTLCIWRKDGESGPRENVVDVRPQIDGLTWGQFAHLRNLLNGARELANSQASNVEELRSLNLYGAQEALRRVLVYGEDGTE